MKAEVEIAGIKFEVNLNEYFDLSIPISTRDDQVNAYYAHPVKMDPYRSGDFVGSVGEGGSVNYRDISFNPHGNGTHTECLGHITEDVQSVNVLFKDFWQPAELVTVTPFKLDNGDRIVEDLEIAGGLHPLTTALIIRTLPNALEKRSGQYSGSNPPYLTDRFIKTLVSAGIKHLLLDLPSVDREVDQGKLLGHRAFWSLDENERKDCTITELIFVPNEVNDGRYILNLQVAPFENDAAPSRPLIYAIKS